MAILRKTERAMMRSMCGVKLLDRKKMEDLMEMLRLKERLDRKAKANGVRYVSFQYVYLSLLITHYQQTNNLLYIQ